MEEGTGGKRLSYTSLPHPLKVTVKIQEKVGDMLPWKRECMCGGGGGVDIEVDYKCAGRFMPEDVRAGVGAGP